MEARVEEEIEFPYYVAGRFEKGIFVKRTAGAWIGGMRLKIKIF